MKVEAEGMDENLAPNFFGWWHHRFGRYPFVARTDRINEA
jgi:hypothetical protein